MLLVLMGVSASGKTTVGRRLAADLGWPFHDGDDFHSPANVEKMRSGVALTDADRDGWLTALAQLIGELGRADGSAVVACSALKQSYRDRLVAAGRSVRFVYLRGTPALLAQRLAARRAHFLPPSLLQSQLDTLEEPADAITVDIDAAPETIAAKIREQLSREH